MPRKVRVLTTSFDAARHDPRADNLALACQFVEAAGAEHADLVCLPETFLEIGKPCGERPIAEAVDGPAFAALARLARKHAVWVVAPISVRTESGRVENRALVIDRQGHLTGSYAKVHPTIGEIGDLRITPGAGPSVVETDFGRVGLAICYDIGWPELWAELKRDGAELVVWPSAYGGGFPLQGYAWLHGYHVVSAVWTEHARIIDITGQVLASTSRWHALAAATIDLEKELFHIDDQVEKLRRLRLEFGQRVAVEAFTEEHWFTLESNDPAWPVSRLKSEFGLENMSDYLRRAEGVQDDRRNEAASAPVAATAIH